MKQADILANKLLEFLNKHGHDGLEAHLEWVDFPLGYKCVTANRPIDYAYFPTRGIVSRFVCTEVTTCGDAGLYGRDGFVGVPLAFGVDRSPHEEVVQVAGEAFRVPAGIVVDLMERDSSVRDLLLRFAFCLSLQASYAALSIAGSDIRNRLCRLLVMCDDRIDGNELSLTHGFLATTLGVRRASVTSAMHHLEGDHLIKATRGRVRIKEREALAEIAGAGYGIAEREYDRLIGQAQPAAESCSCVII